MPSGLPNWLDNRSWETGPSSASLADGRTHDFVLALRAVTSTDGMTSAAYQFPGDFLPRVATRIVNEVRGINRVTYDYTAKPPGTIEWE